jgi:protein-disulfide isomerase
MDAADRAPMVEPLDEQIDHVRGEADAAVILEYGDYECPYSRQAFRAIEQGERQLSGRVRFAFRHFPLTQIHQHALAAAAAAEAAGRQQRFWEMHEVLFHRQKALEDDDLRSYANEIGLDLARFDRDRADAEVLARIARDVTSGKPRVSFDPAAFIEALATGGNTASSSALLEESINSEERDR